MLFQGVPEYETASDLKNAAFVILGLLAWFAIMLGVMIILSDILKIQ